MGRRDANASSLPTSDALSPPAASATTAFCNYNNTPPPKTAESGKTGNREMETELYGSRLYICYVRLSVCFLQREGVSRNGRIPW